MQSKQTKVINQALRELNRIPVGGPKQSRISTFKGRLRVYIITLLILALALAGILYGISREPLYQVTPAKIQEGPGIAKEAPEDTRYTHEQEFKVTYYCGCKKCCGIYSSGSELQATGALGEKLIPYYSIAVDPKVIPLGSIVYDMEGNPYKAMDTGGMIKGSHIDIFTGNHQEALNMAQTKLTLYW